MKSPDLKQHLQTVYTPTDLAGISRWTYTLIMVLLLIGVVWMFTAPLASAVIVTGNVKVYKNRVVLQHPEGGVIESLLVEEGDRVQSGQTLMTLTNPQLLSTVRSLERQLFSERLRVLRLQAEMAYPYAELDLQPGDDWDEEQRAIARTEQRLFDSRIRNLRTQETSVQQQIEHVQSEIVSLRRSLANDQVIVERTQELARQGFVSKVNALVSEQAIHQREADLARALQRIAELEQRLPVLQEDFRNASVAEYRAVNERILDVQERLRPAQEAVRNLKIRATTDGTIVNLTRLGPGSVLGAKETIAELVPVDRGLILEGTLSPEQVAFIEPGMQARVRINQLLKIGIDEFVGEVRTLSADSVSQGTLGTPAYLVQVDIGDLPDSIMAELKPGMPAEMFVQTGSRTPFQYISQPITDFMNRAAIQ